MTLMRILDELSPPLRDTGGIPSSPGKNLCSRRSRREDDDEDDEDEDDARMMMMAMMMMRRSRDAGGEGGGGWEGRRLKSNNPNLKGGEKQQRFSSNVLFVDRFR